MKTIFVLIVQLFFYSVILGQEQIDSLIHKSKKIDPELKSLIYDYRIPEWGYQRLYISLSGSTSGYDYDYENIVGKSQNYSSNINPYYYKYKTSEKMTYSIDSYVESRFGYNKYKYNNESSLEKNEGHDLNMQYHLGANFNRYIKESLFINFDTDNNFRYSESIDKRTNIQNGITDEDRRTRIYRQYETNIQLGFGYGKVRNVNPVVKAIRFSERLKDLVKTSGLNLEETKQLAGLFARQSSFSNTYERYLKYFYDQLPKSISNQILDLKPWEMMYLHEVFDELNGNRYEGFIIDGGLTIDHSRRRDASNYTTQINNSELTLLGLYFEQLYYHNLSPNYQIGTNIYASYSKAMNENTNTDFLGRGSIRLMNLWNLTDRMLIEFQIGYNTSFSSIKINTILSDGSEQIDKEWERADDYSVNVSFDYFLENNLSVFSTISNYLSYDWPANLSSVSKSASSTKEKDINWFVRFGIRYYFLRGLL